MTFGRDDAGVTGLKARCRGPGLTGDLEHELGEDGDWFIDTRWGGWSATCVPGKAVCSLKTRVEADRGNLYDDTALTDAVMTCC